MKRGRSRPRVGPILYTGQDLARFCEVDLKTVHHWAERGKVPHFRTTGRHLRFRRNDVVRFLRSHGYPMPDALTSARPAIALAATLPDDAGKKLASRFVVHRFETAIVAVSRLLADQPDALVVSWDDPTLGAENAIAALKNDSQTCWVLLVVIAHEERHAAAHSAGADVVVAPDDLGRLASELARTLAVA
jgi:excisionase family DNA binding protein